MFSSISVIGLIFAGLATVHGFYEVSVTEEEQEHRGPRHSVENYMDCVAPLIQLRHSRVTYWQGINLKESVALAYSGGYIYHGFLGRVMAKKEGCECGDGTELIPATMMIKAGSYDYFLTTSADEIAQHKQTGYAEKRVEFYCSPEQNKCGATLPLYRNKAPSYVPYNTLYTTNAKQHEVWETGTSWKRDGIICYIWPEQYNAHNLNGQN